MYILDSDTFDRAALFDLIDARLTVAANQLSRSHISPAERDRMRRVFRRSVYEAMDDVIAMDLHVATATSLANAAYLAAISIFRAAMLEDGSIDERGLSDHEYPRRCFHNQVLSTLRDAVDTAQADFARFIAAPDGAFKQYGDEMGRDDFRRLNRWPGRPTALLEAMRDAEQEWPG